jgi:hypothetical protein
MRSKVLSGRNEHGFVLGSPQAEQFQRMLDASRKGTPAAKRPRQPKRTHERTAKRRNRLQRQLARPDWWDDDMPQTQARNRRYIARQKAKRAALMLGVDVPEWVHLHERWGGTREGSCIRPKPAL